MTHKYENDARFKGVMTGLQQLTRGQLRRLFKHLVSHAPILLDRNDMGQANCDGKTFCPIGIALGLFGSEIGTDEEAQELFSSLGLDYQNTRGVQGDFYRGPDWRRHEDMLFAVMLCLYE